MNSLDGWYDTREEAMEASEAVVLSELRKGPRTREELAKACGGHLRHPIRRLVEDGRIRSGWIDREGRRVRAYEEVN